MPENEQDLQVDTTETVPLSPEWGGVPVAGGDNADATGGTPSEPEPVAIQTEEDADDGEQEAADDAAEPVAAQADEAAAPDAGDGEQEAADEAAEPVASQADEANAPDADDGEQEAETADEAAGARA